MNQKCVLIVDDDSDVRTLLKKGLEAENFSCVCVSSVEKALEVLKPVNPDVVILDLGLPKANGTAFIQNARNWLGSDSVPPIIVLSGHKDKEVVDYTLDMGAAGFIGKPYDMRELISMVHEQVA